ncbi:MAG: gluconate 2-dehydrogenase subunit 3 family protein [Deltaproteobacteria bacterium]|nr:gluconate 2-dehydrogenase subunit 3 family protein [Candidatus Zymogenaceae bacterium]
MSGDLVFQFNATRRTFLRGFALAASALAVGTGATGCAGYPEVPSGLKFLDEKGFAVMSAFADRIIPSGGSYEIGAAETRVVEFFDEFAATDYPEAQKDFKSVITLLEHGPLFMQFSAKRFTEMTPDEQDKYLEKWETSNSVLLRGAFVGIKKLCMMGFYTNELVWPHIGYDGPLV